MLKDFIKITENYILSLCGVKPNRRTGSSGNRKATKFFAQTIQSFGYTTDTTPFNCLDYIRGSYSLTHDNQSFEIYVSPYSLGCNVLAALSVVTTLKELEAAHCRNKILLLKGAICSEQLMPKNFVFYNPEHHQRIISLLEEKKPAAIITATEKKPEQVGALYPFPLIVDGDFNIPNVYCRDSVGEVLVGMAGQLFTLLIDANRLHSIANNVIARLNQDEPEKIVITAHIDAYEDTPGALDNASGTTVLLLVAEMLSDYQGNRCIEIAALNGEDHYSAGGQMDYIKRNRSEINSTVLAINIDDVGFTKGKTSYSIYECPIEVQHKIDAALQVFDNLVQGEQWYSGDHMIFVQKGVPSLAFTAEKMPELMRTVTHTSLDTPDLIDSQKLVELAQALASLIRKL